MSHNTQAAHVDTSLRNFRIVQEGEITSQIQLGLQNNHRVNVISSKVHIKITARLQLRKKPYNTKIIISTV